MSSAGSASSSTKAIAANTASVRNCRVRYAEAPSCTAWAMVFMLLGALTSGEHLRPEDARHGQRDERDDGDDDDQGEVSAGEVHGGLGVSDAEGNPGHAFPPIRASRPFDVSEHRTDDRG